MVLNCGVGEDSWESHGDCKEMQPVLPKEDQSWVSFIGSPSLEVLHWKDWCWYWNSSTLATWGKELTHLKRPWCWERLGAGGKGKTEDEMVVWHHRLNGHEFGGLQELVMDREAQRAAIHGVTKNRTRLRDWTELNWTELTEAPHAWSCWKGGKNVCFEASFAH